MSRDADALAPLLSAFQSRQPIRAWSLIVTVFGDVVRPRGGEIGLRALTLLMEAAGIGNGVVRTAMSRLAADGWLERVREGRLSYYRLSARALCESQAAAPRIYGSAVAPWDEYFVVAVLPPGNAAAKARIKLADLGLFAAGAELMLGPRSDRLREGLTEAARTLEGCLVMEGMAANIGGHGAAADLLAEACQLAPIGQAYERFMAAAEVLHHAPPADGLLAMVARMLLLHEYRRVRLRDPGLPLALCPPNWPGPRAQALTRAVYGALLQPSEAWLDAHADTSSGQMPRPAFDLAARFGL